jgi:DNA-binding SARP family transcriptional activator
MTRRCGSADVEVRLLGPLEVLRRGERVALAGAKQRAVLAVLVLHANEPVGTERLVDAVWGDEAPLTAAKIVHNNVSQLRKLLEPDVSRDGRNGYELLKSGRSGYELRIEPERVDTCRFERLVQEGRAALTAGDPAAASARLREALALWRGPALADLTFAPFVEPQRVHFDELRLVAIEDRVEADLLGGHTADLVAELEALVTEHPLRERLRGQLMLALYRAGRQADALSLYQSTRRLLVDELGIDPSPALQRLQQAILRQDADLERGVALPAPRRRREVRKTVSVVIAELVPTGPPLDPEVLHERLAPALDDVSSCLEQHGAAVERGIGGALLAVFGTPLVREDDPLRAVRAALDARRAAAAASERLERELGGRLVFRAAVATGEGLGGAAIDCALRLQREARPDEILVADATRDLLQDAVRVQRVTRGRARAWQLEDVVSIGDTGMREPRAPLVGRTRELDALRHALERSVREQSPYLFTILGPAGLGKSRLANEFVSSLGRRATVLRGRCLSYGGGALSPIAAMVEEHCGGVGLDASATPAETFSAARELFESQARTRPLVLVVEDLHWAQPTLLDLIENLVDRTRGAPILVVCLARPELLEARGTWGGGKLNATSMLLAPLSDGESQTLMDHLAAGTPIPRETRTRAAALAEGNPLFLEQMLAMLRERGLSAEPALPPTIQALIAARLDRLDVGEREVLEHASVIGKEFWREALAELIPPDLRGDSEQYVEALQRRDLIRPCRTLLAEDGFEFQHVLVREVAYESLPKRLRAQLHERLALWLEQSFATREGELDELLGHHYERAHLYHVELRLDDAHAAELAARATGRLASSGRRAYGRDDLPTAVTLLARAAAVCRTGAPERVELLLDYGDALRETGELERAAAVLAEAAVSARDESDNAYVDIARLRLQLQTDPEIDIEAVSREARRAVAIFEEREQDRRLAKAWELLAWVPWFQCQAARTDAALQKAVACARRAGDRRTEAQSLHLLIGATYFGPMPIAAAVRRCEEVLARPGAQPRVRAAALRAQAGLAAWAGEEERARALVRSHRRLVRDLGLRVSAASAAETYGTVELAAGDPVAAEAEFRRGLESLDELRDRTVSALLAGLLAHALHLQGRDDDALELSERSRNAAGADDLVAQVQWRTARAKPLARVGRGAEAESLAREALTLARTTDFLATRAQAAMDLAEVLTLDGRGAEAIPYLEEALAQYEQKGCSVHAARARRALEDVGSTALVP